MARNCPNQPPGKSLGLVGSKSKKLSSPLKEIKKKKKPRKVQVEHQLRSGKSRATPVIINKKGIRKRSQPKVSLSKASTPLPKLPAIWKNDRIIMAARAKKIIIITPRFASGFR